MKNVTKAVIPAAGLGTRMLPISRAVPKEVLPIVDRPAIHYLVEEAVMSGITDILIITNRDKDPIEEYFDYSPEYDAKLRSSGKNADADALRAVADMANVFFIRQKEPKGLGHAVARAKNFVGDEPFCVLYGDDIITAQKPVCKQLIESYERYGRPVVGVKKVSDADVARYCSMKAVPIEGGVGEYFVDDMIEKPKPHQVMSNLAILGRVLLPAEIFDIIDGLAPGAGGEIQLTDAMGEYSRRHGVTALEFEGVRYDMGSKLGFMTANVTEALKHPDIGEEFAVFLKELVKTL